jgi:hypothetical protein
MVHELEFPEGSLLTHKLVEIQERLVSSPTINGTGNKKDRSKKALSIKDDHFVEMGGGKDVKNKDQSMITTIM